ncbi:hypothetical protein QQ045_018130 [Rhodiola kirilowii]
MMNIHLTTGVTDHTHHIIEGGRDEGDHIHALNLILKMNIITAEVIEAATAHVASMYEGKGEVTTRVLHPDQENTTPAALPEVHLQKAEVRHQGGNDHQAMQPVRALAQFLDQ